MGIRTSAFQMNGIEQKMKMFTCDQKKN